VTLEDVWKPLGRCFKSNKKEKIRFRNALKSAIIDDLKLLKREQKHSTDPFLSLGFGILSYLDMLKSLSGLFIMITIFCIPLFYIYGTGEAFSNERSFPVSRFMLGNIGASTMACVHESMRDGKLELTCPPGSFHDSSHATFGMISSEIDAKFKHSCLQTGELDEEIASNSDVYNCTSFIDHTKMNNQLSTECHGKDSCLLSLHGMTKSFGRDPSMLKPNGQCGPLANFFMQAPCLIPH